MGGKWILFIVMFLLYASLIKTDVSWNDGSRLATVESIVERGTLAIDDSSFFNSTSDRIFYNNRFYSDKAPGMAFLGVPVYFVLASFGMTFSTGTAAIFALNLVVALLSALLAVLFYDSLKYFVGSKRQRAILSFSLALATGIAVYSGVFVSPNVAAFFTFASFYFLLKYVKEKPSTANAILAGVMGGFAVLVEYTSLILLFFIFAYALLSTAKRKRIFLAPLAIAPFILAILFYNFAITENPLVSPYAYLHSWEGSPFSAGEDVPSLGRVTAPRFFSMFFFGGVPRAEGIYVRGLFVYSPILLLSLFSLRRIRAKENILLLAAAAFSFFYLTLAEVTGGCNYVNRYLIPAVPLLMIAIAANFGSLALRKIFYVLLPVSVAANLLGSLIYPFACSHFSLFDAFQRVAAGDLPFSGLNAAFAVAFILVASIAFYRRGFTSR